jgi:hypothetical protein
MAINTENTDSDFTKFKYKMSGEYVVNNLDTWVFDVSVFHNEKQIYVIGFSPKQTEGAVFSQLGTYEKEKIYIDDLETIKRDARMFVINLGLFPIKLEINKFFNYAEFHKVIEQNKLKLWQQESMGIHLYKKPNKWYYWITEIIPKISKEVITTDTSGQITCTNISKHDTITFYTFATNSSGNDCEAIYFKKFSK